MVVEFVDDLNSILSEWCDLWQRTPDATPFQHPGWLVPWWTTFGSGRLYSFAARDGGRVRGLALLFLHPWQGRRQVTFLGNGVSDRQDFLGDAACASLFLRALAELRREWDVCDLQELGEDSPLRRAQIPAALSSEIRFQSTCSQVALPASVNEYKASLPHGLRRNLRRYRKQLEEQGDLRFESATPVTFEPLLDALFLLHRARWAMKDDSGMLDGPAKEAFHRAAASQLYRAGLARLNALYLNGKPIAITYELLRGPHVYNYLGGFEPSLSQYGIGKLVQEYAICQAIEQQMTIFDFLRGDEPYKSDWGVQRSPASRLLLHPL